MKKKKYSQSEMFIFVEQWQKSGLKRAEFARSHGITKDSFYYWHDKYNKTIVAQKESASNVSCDFLPIQVAPSNQQSKSPILEITYSNGTQVSLYQEVSIALLSSLINR